MKKTIALLTIAAMPMVNAKMMMMSMPKVYGELNKVLSYEKKRHSSGVVDVANRDSKIGVMGHAGKATYRLELKSNVSSAVSVKRANISFKSRLGMISVGKSYPILSTVAKMSDPLSMTIGSFEGKDQQRLGLLEAGGIGFKYREEVERISYKSMRMAGLSLMLSSDNDPSTSTHYEFLVQYDRDMSMFDVHFYRWTRLFTI